MSSPKLYHQLADWWPLMSAPTDYEEEATFYERMLIESCKGECRHVLELGSGGGNNASYMKQRFTMVLADRSPGMLAVSRALNPECEHVEGDMRSLRLFHQFDAVFVHDAVCYVLRERDGAARVELDRHIEGLFARDQWLRWLADAGFEARVVSFDHSELEPGTYQVFTGCRISSGKLTT